MSLRFAFRSSWQTHPLRTAAILCAAWFSIPDVTAHGQVSVSIKTDTIEADVETDIVRTSAARSSTLPLSSPDQPSRTSTPALISFPAEHHPWARFEPGAWRTIRITTESFDAAGKFLGRSETTQTDRLIEVNENYFGLETTNVVHVGGKKLRGATQQTNHSLLADSAGELIELTELTQANLKLGERLIPCRRLQLTFDAAGQRRQETVFYSSAVSPYILRREIITTAQPTEALTATIKEASATDVSTTLSHGQPTLDDPPLEEISIAVVRIDLPVSLDDELAPGCNAVVVKRSGDHQTESLEVWSDVAPGGLVSASTTERDATGRRVRWTSTELVEFGQAGESPESEPRRRWRLFRRRNDG